MPTTHERLRAAGVAAVADPVARFAAAGAIELWPAIDAAVAETRIRPSAPPLAGIVATLAWPERPDAFKATLEDGFLGGEVPLGRGAWLSCRGQGLELHIPGSLPETIIEGSRGRHLSELVAISAAVGADWIVTSVRNEDRGRGALAQRWLVIAASVTVLGVAAASDLIDRWI